MALKTGLMEITSNIYKTKMIGAFKRNEDILSRNFYKDINIEQHQNYLLKEETEKSSETFIKTNPMCDLNCIYYSFIKEKFRIAFNGILLSYFTKRPNDGNRGNESVDVTAEKDNALNKYKTRLEAIKKILREKRAKMKTLESEGKPNKS
ncbi:uncharacterized protein LOC101738646 [Bombyx mori]|uniref:Uncharacterized protein n=1 Tax=Bombyx mori TaxID=7091 RepID=A0A8R2ANB7_BOMMO|nr:uncharacterized protein LOC101738646 [Bombyx mori]